MEVINSKGYNAMFFIAEALLLSPDYQTQIVLAYYYDISNQKRLYY